MRVLQSFQLILFTPLLLLPSTQSFIINSQPSSSSSMRTTKSTTLLRMAASSQNSNKPSVAIIGGGIAGLSCAQHLQSSGSYSPTVFDTGRLRPGGRCSSRYPNDKPKDRSQNQSSILSQYTIDHSAQILVVPGVRGAKNDGFHSFQKQVDQWRADGVVQQFPKDSVVEIVAKTPSAAAANTNNKDKAAAPLVRPIDSKNMYYCTDGFGSIPLNMATANEIKIEQDVWISPSSGVKYVGTKASPQWSVQTNGKRFGNFDHVIIAHNGKCADRLMSKSPAKDLHSLLVVDFKPEVPNWGGKRMTLNSIYSLTVALKMGSEEKLSQVVGKDVMTAFVKNEPTLKLITNQSNKLGSTSAQSKGEEGLEIWTILSSAKFAKKYKGPQENLPQERVEEVTSLMLAALERSLGLEEGTIHEGTVKDSRLQLWGAAVPLNVWSPTGKDVDSNNSGFMYDAEHRVGACGDWLLDPSIAGAWESGRRLANWMSSGLEQDGKPIDAVSVGLPSLGGEFKQSKAASGSGIGNVR